MSKEALVLLDVTFLAIHCQRFFRPCRSGFDARIINQQQPDNEHRLSPCLKIAEQAGTDFLSRDRAVIAACEGGSAFASDSPLLAIEGPENGRREAE